MKRARSRVSGSTLLLALWALLLLSAVVFAWVQGIGREIDAVSDANRGMEARALAHSGMAVALNPRVSRLSPHLHAVFEREREYRVTFESEGNRINLNYLLAGCDPQKIDFLKSVLALRGLALPEREVLVDCLLDWVSPSTGLRRPNGRAEGPDYHPPHRPLQSLDELPLVAGSAPLVSKPGWREWFTLESTGPLDLESVSAEWLALVPGVGEPRARRFVKLREARLLSSKDPEGYPFKNLDEALADLGFSEEQFAPLSLFLGFRDPVCRIESVGKSADAIRQVTAIVRKVPGVSCKILLWTEN